MKRAKVKWRGKKTRDQNKGESSLWSCPILSPRCCPALCTMCEYVTSQQMLRTNRIWEQRRGL